MNKSQFDLAKEKIESTIRVEQIKQLENKHKVEVENTKQSDFDVKVAVNQTNLSSISVERSTVKLDIARKELTLDRLTSARKSIDVTTNSRENSLYSQVQNLKLEGIETGITEAKKLLDNRRTYLIQQGIL
jgi:sucrose-6-phosphate hydrolase SacC (GH32 family)